MTNIRHIMCVFFRLPAIAVVLLVGACAQNTVTGTTSTPIATATQPHAAPVENISPAKPGQTRIALLPNPTPNAESQALTIEMAKMLALNGYHLVPPPDQVAADEDLFFIVPEFNMKASENGQNVMEVAWIVANSSGDTLGKVSQKREVRGSPDSAGWKRQTALGAAAAAEGVSQIIREQKNL